MSRTLPSTGDFKFYLGGDGIDEDFKKRHKIFNLVSGGLRRI